MRTITLTQDLPNIKVRDALGAERVVSLTKGVNHVEADVAAHWYVRKFTVPNAVPRFAIPARKPKPKPQPDAPAAEVGPDVRRRKVRRSP